MSYDNEFNSTIPILYKCSHSGDDQTKYLSNPTVYQIKTTIEH
jgi:hypothetical protein